MSFFRCPLCALPLTEAGGGLVCPGGHRFDRAREGYVHLLPVGQKHSKAPGDDKGMVAARRAFLDRGYYAPLRDALCALAAELTGPAPAVLDAGCGEGYYTAAVHAALLAAGKAPETAGIDISKFSLQKAARRCRDVEYAVASAYRLPAADGRADLLTDVFSPLAIDEFRRVLRPGGCFVYVVPAAMHLWELQQVLDDQPYPNEERLDPYPGFALERVVPVAFDFHLPDQGDIQALFGMTPYAWKTPRAGKDRLAELTELTCRADFRILAFRREG